MSLNVYILLIPAWLNARTKGDWPAVEAFLLWNLRHKTIWWLVQHTGINVDHWKEPTCPLQSRTRSGTMISKVDMSLDFRCRTNIEEYNPEEDSTHSRCDVPTRIDCLCSCTVQFFIKPQINKISGACSLQCNDLCTSHCKHCRDDRGEQSYKPATCTRFQVLVENINFDS